jgi:hypothetical protein
VVKVVASLGIFVLMALLFLAFLTTLRPSAIAVVQGDEVIDVAPMKHTLARPERLLTNRDPPNCSSPLKGVKLDADEGSNLRVD